MRTIVLAAALMLAGCSSWERTTEPYDSSKMTGYFDIYRPIDQGPTELRPCVLFVHGGAFEMGDKQGAGRYADLLCEKGYVVLSPNYRLSSSGARWPAQIDDVRQAFQYIHAHAAELRVKEPVAVMGVSAGGCLALLLHLMPGMPPSTCCVDISGESDFTLDPGMSDQTRIMTELLGSAPPWPPAQLQGMSPVTFAKQDAHVLILHSSMDGNVYVANADRLAAALAKVQAEVSFDRPVGYAHGDDLWEQYTPAKKETASFLDLHKPK